MDGGSNGGGGSNDGGGSSGSGSNGSSQASQPMGVGGSNGEGGKRTTPPYPRRKKSRFAPEDIPEPPSFKGLMMVVQSIADSLVVPPPTTAADVSDALKQLDGITRELYLRGMDLLGDNTKLANTFIALDDDTKMEWLIRRLNREGL